ncbi:hypothetical protein PF011_g1 [Phytophthora fragariae]|uniref:Reverse transcriptase/retrotransposon-derived protein RNase H-like domain-containing protein n=1 Tax=Phytophthora fragariae TaxID=53985 RepID=A0A6A3MPU8_9STRA|nr:hypothetical protein PF011_g1 [Phytophthora fragariae]
MKFDTGAEDLPVDASMSTGNPNTGATHVAREDCLHLADPEWEALQRLSTVIGEAAVATMLRTLSPTEQHGVALGFIMKEQRETAARATVSTPSTPRVESLKLHVNIYVGREGEPLLRLLVEVDTAITARRIVDPLSKVSFAMSCLGKHKLYANLKKCIFGASEIPVLGCLVGKNGIRPDPGKVRVINEWPTPSNVKEPRQFLGLATYLCKYVSNYAGKIRPLSQLLKEDAAWVWTADCQQTFDAVKQGLTEATILAVADQDRPFHVVCDASDFAIGCTLMQHDHEGRDRVVYYQSRQLKPAERNYPVHDKELLAMKYALAKFRVYLLGSRPFVVYTDHASLRTAIKSPHISQRMARWLSFFAEYNFQVEYKPGRLNVVADALSRRPDYALHKADANAIGVARTSTPSSSLLDDVRSAYTNDAVAKQLLDYFAAPSDKSRQRLAKHLRARVHRYRVRNGLLLYSAVDDNADRIVVPDDNELKLRITYAYNDAPTSGHQGREKTYLLLTRDFYWSHQYKWVRKYVRACEVCQRVKPAPFSQAPLQSLPTPSECRQSMEHGLCVWSSA